MRTAHATIAGMLVIGVTCPSALGEEAAMPSSYAVGEHFERFIQAQVESGRYASISEVAREALRLLEDRERLRELHIAELRRQVEEGMNSGPGLPAEDVFARLEAKYEIMVEQRRSA